ncbi:MAG: glycosyltransferase [Planctomycetaceae bacterium]|jgi:glycosyltransferase involved in cell wall biosynthesis|nr:glycosyltransferase [Planctomycetaceae bacterium]
MNPKISVVVPVYNVEKYLRECLDSIVNQTLRELQIICVNDGSPDNSLAILNEYAAKDERIMIINKKNGGLSSARNAAYPHLKGKYTLFVDSDDWIDLQLCEKTLIKAEETGAEMTVFFSYWENGLKPSCDNLTAGYKKTVLEKSTVVDYPCAWGKLWKTDFLISHQLFFPMGLFAEDRLMNWQSVVVANTIYVLSEKLYSWRVNPDSLTRSLDVKSKCADYLEIYRRIKSWLVKTGNYELYKDKFHQNKVSFLNEQIFYLSGEDEDLFKKEVYQCLTKGDWEFIDSPQCPDLMRMGFYEMQRYYEGKSIRSYLKLPEQLLRYYIINPIRRRFAE